MKLYDVWTIYNFELSSHPFPFQILTFFLFRILTFMLIPENYDYVINT